jgi:hypothetical protein
LGDKIVTKVTAALCAAITVTAVAGCTTTPSEPTPSPTTSASAGVSSSPTVSSSASDAFEPDTVFGPTKDELWQEHAGPGKGPFSNYDESVKPGSYRLDVACRGGAITVTGTGGETLVKCSEGSVIIPVCIAKPGLKLTATWTSGADGDLVWRLRRHPGTTCK